VIVAVDWVAVSAVVTAVATLVLAGATFFSVRSAGRTARATERSLLAGLQPLLMPSRPDDPPQKVGFMDNKWFHVLGGAGVAEASDDAVYLAIAVRNVGNGIAVLHGWHFHADPVSGRDAHPPLESFRPLTRDLYIAPNEIGFWQGAFRDRADPDFVAARDAIDEPRRFAIDVLYGDHELGERSVTRFALNPRGDGSGWIATVSRHWNVDRPDPR
jgi:hypothetical protein